MTFSKMDIYFVIIMDGMKIFFYGKYKTKELVKEYINFFCNNTRKKNFHHHFRPTVYYFVCKNENECLEIFFSTSL